MKANHSKDATEPGRPAPARCLVLGLGNDLLSDDAIGLRVAAAARHQLRHQREIKVLLAEEMGLALLDLVEGFDRLLLVDAIQTGRAAPGFVHEFDLAASASTPSLSPHFLGVNEMLALGNELGLAVPRHVKIIAIETQDPFTLGLELTPPLAAALPTIIERVVSTARTFAQAAPVPSGGRVPGPKRAAGETNAAHAAHAAQGEFAFDSGQNPDGYGHWLTGRKMAARELARRFNLPLGHQVEVWLRGGVRLHGTLKLREELLFLEEDRVRHLELTVDHVHFTVREMESCVRLD